MRTAGLLALLICLFAASARSHRGHRKRRRPSRPSRRWPRSSPASPTSEPPSIEGDMRAPGLRSVSRPAAAPGYRLVARGQGPVPRRILSRGLHLRKAGADLRGRGRQRHAALRSRPTSSTSPTSGLKTLPKNLTLGGLSPAPSAEPSGQVRRGDLLPGRELLPADRRAARATAPRRAGLPSTRRWRKPEEFPALPHLLAGEARGRGDRR